MQLAFDVTGDPAFPERPAFEVARELGLPVTTHAGRLGRDQRRRHPADARERLHDAPDTVYVHAATLDTDSYLRIAATGGSVSVSTESEQSAGQGYPPTWQVRRYDIPVSLSMDTSVWWSGDLFSAMRTHARRGPGPRAPGGARRRRDRHHLAPAGRARRRLGHPRRRPERSVGTTSAASTPAQKADVVLIKNDHSPVSFPLLNPYGHVAFQAQRGDVHTVLVDGGS